jgi:hypothetical protein
MNLNGGASNGWSATDTKVPNKIFNPTDVRIDLK